MKKMFKTVLFLLVSTFLTSNLFAQGMYVRLNAGYGMNAGAQNLDGFYNETSSYRSSNNSTDHTYEQINVSLGKGLNVGGALGFMFSANFGAELGVSYLLGGKSTATDTYNGSSYSETYEYTISAKMLRINPSLVLTTGAEGLSPYAKFGLVAGMGSILMEYMNNDDGDVYIEKTKLNGGTALGLTAALGVNYKLSESMSLFGEINMVNMSYAPTTGEITEATYNGANKLPDYTTNEKLTDFVDSYSYNSQDNQSENEPDQELKQKMPFGSIGVNLGLTIKF
jgi:hypothetical protein